MLRLIANRLEGPQLQYRSASNPTQSVYPPRQVVNDGSWILRNMLLNRAGVGERWSCIELESHNGECNAAEINHFLIEMERHLIQNGIFQRDQYMDCRDCPQSNTGSCHVVTYPQIRNKETLVRKFQHFKKQRVKILFVILPDKDPATYAMVKKVADLEVGIHTTCIVRHPNWKRGLKSKGHPLRQSKWDPDAALNILQKVNLRLGGDNLILANRAGAPALHPRDHHPRRRRHPPLHHQPKGMPQRRRRGRLRRPQLQPLQRLHPLPNRQTRIHHPLRRNGRRAPRPLAHPQRRRHLQIYRPEPTPPPPIPHPPRHLPRRRLREPSSR